MSSPLIFHTLANTVLTLHVALVLFVILGLPLVLVGHLRGWRWANTLWFRLLHLATISIVAAEAWLGLECPLTSLERWLRSKTDVVGYEGGFIEHWLQALLFWQAPPWVFTMAYTLFALAVAAVWYYFPPNFKHPNRI